MFDGCFGLAQRPFASVPEVGQYFPGTAIESARTALARCIQRGEGSSLVVGPSGTGKTLLCLMLADQFRRSFRVAMLPSGRLSTRRALFQAIRYEFGRPYRGMDEGELRLAVVDDLTSGDDGSRGLVLLVDEAHVLPLRLLEELRLLTNLAHGGQPLVRLVLAGGPVLEERFASPKLDSFNQRLAARCYLDAFNRAETLGYVRHQIQCAGGDGASLFPEEACQAVFQATSGVPRLINQVCDHAMLLSYVAGRQQIGPADIEEAWADLQQLPTPWSGASKDESTGGVIEFGSLDDSANEAAGSRELMSASADAAPTLRISPGLDDADADFGEPSQQIHRIEQLLAEAEDDFRPAGSIKPEIELHFEDATHPFQDAFEHEEVVSDRYAAAKQSMVSRTDTDFGDSSLQESSGGNVEYVDAVSPMPDQDGAAVPEISVAAVDAIVAAPDVEVNAAHAPSVVPASMPTAAVAESDRLILCGDGDSVGLAAEVLIPPPRPLQFRGLFARLRQGCTQSTLK